MDKKKMNLTIHQLAIIIQELAEHGVVYVRVDNATQIQDCLEQANIKYDTRHTDDEKHVRIDVTIS